MSSLPLSLKTPLFFFFGPPWSLEIAYELCYYAARKSIVCSDGALCAIIIMGCADGFRVISSCFSLNELPICLRRSVNACRAGYFEDNQALQRVLPSSRHGAAAWFGCWQCP